MLKYSNRKWKIQITAKQQLFYISFEENLIWITERATYLVSDRMTPKLCWQYGIAQVNMLVFKLECTYVYLCSRFLFVR